METPMRLERLENVLVQQIEPVEPEPEDAWLNDVGPSSRPEPQKENAEKEALSPQIETYTLIDHIELLSRQNMPVDQASSDPQHYTPADPAPPLSQSGVRIEHSHHLWPVLLRLSKQIWQEFHQESGSASISEPTVVELVRNRCLELLRADLTLASQVRDLAEAEQLLQSVVSEVMGYGPLEALLQSDDISEIMIVGPRLTYVKCDGKLEESPYRFEDDRHILRIIENMLLRAGQYIELGRPLAEIRLPGGACASIIMPPYAIHGPAITIRKNSRLPFTLADLVKQGSITQEMADFLSTCVQASLNIVVCGCCGSGRTTLLNALGLCIPSHERIVTIEDVAELKLDHRHVVALEAQQADLEGVHRVSMRDLVQYALHMRPEHIIVGECKGIEVVELLQAMYTGCDGILTSIYANNVRDCLARLEVMCQVGRTRLPLASMRTQLAAAVNLLVYTTHLRDGSHKIMNIAEVQGIEDDTIKLQSIFYFQDEGVDVKTGKVRGTFKSGGFLPNFMPKLEAANIHLPRDMFVPHHTTP
jgi:pilus assembly protein CpaF